MKGQSKRSGEHLIFSNVKQQENGKYEGFWSVGTRNGKEEFDTEEEARDYCKRNINRETGFTE